MSYDNLCKLLAEKHPNSFVTWLLGEESNDTQVLKTELSIEPIRADSVIFLQTSTRLLHIEFQTQWQSNPPLPLRLLDYWVRLYRLYRLPVSQYVIMLLPPGDTEVIETVFELETTRHQYNVIKMWEEEPERFLQDKALLPLATLTSTTKPPNLLNLVAQKINEIEEYEERYQIAAYVQLIAGLKYDKEIIRQIFSEDMMKDSVIYQDILQKGEDRGLQQGLQQGETKIVLRLLTQKLGTFNPEITTQISALPPEKLESLAESLLSFTVIADLISWLENN
jgi:predicted transposase/invertase (TIGR01784 family)